MAIDLNLERFRPYLLVLTQVHMGQRLRAKFDVADVVQMTLLEAHRNSAQFRGRGEPELKGWLRQILVRTIISLTRSLTSAKREADRERSLQEAMDASSMRLEQWLVADDSSPSTRAQRHEDAERLAQALAELPEAQREALTLRHLQECSLHEIAKRMDRSLDAVVRLLKSGGRHLAALLELPEAKDSGDAT